MVPDINYPSLFDPEKIGESALDNALAWDQIAPTRFNRYNNYDSIIPTLASLHNARAANDPDYQFLQDQVDLAQGARGISVLPLQQSGRVAMRDEQEALALAIENKRRLSKGLEPLETLDTDDDVPESTPTVSNEETALPHNEVEDAADGEAATPDVLLLETGKILVDSISLRPTDSVASRSARES
ncbi:MAG: carboxy terminal-processing peptidase [Halieaceae bacterium]|nr:carboxy terminal-processing peptidase [Halieaceae bacterium]